MDLLNHRRDCGSSKGVHSRLEGCIRHVSNFETNSLASSKGIFEFISGAVYRCWCLPPCISLSLSALTYQNV